MTLIDSHCHLQSLPPDERERALDAARERGVRGFLVPATRLDESDEILALCHRHPDLWCALGVHPHEAASWSTGDDRRLAELLEDERAVAVGECGLDFHYDNAPRAVQVEVMRAQWELARERRLPVVVHNRDSDAEMLRQLGDPRFSGLQADFHSFAGGAELLERVLESGCYVGVSGMVTFRRAENIREIVRRVPPDRLLLETDTPYLAPEPYRGRTNQPAWVVEVAVRVAVEWGWSEGEVGQRTAQNFRDLFQPSGTATASRQMPANQG